MSAHLENAAEEIQDLVGATILAAWVEDTDGEQRVRLRVKFRDDLRVNDSPLGEYEIWQDEEGNGPGFLAFMGPGT
jgi:hypothetical protein